ncbi:lysophospholipid acyltransferase 1 isoform X2 [Takifugu rubripes]|uniref:Membrane bound O-acyltransferase domain containing 1 n=1 Tax=Takifugu rubripes TaxID=31033 RepID=A0A674MFS3_TAKRU|nr:lysophospholipid acyltransferase 1 isoform X2 [Takifugu rubripes]
MSEPAFNTTGSLLLLPVSQSLGFPLDQVNFVTCQLFALAAAFWFRLYLSPSRASPRVRHAVATTIGSAFLIFCFGWYSLVTAMGYLTACQACRAYIFNYAVPSTDFSGPLMIVAQKITTLAFQLHDGMCKKPDQLTPEQKLLAINARPSPLQYLSYTLNFLSVLVGPCSNYRDYLDFIEGRHISRRLRRLSGACNGHNGHITAPDPSPLGAVCRKLLVCSGCMLFFLVVTRSLPIRLNVEPDFVSQNSFLVRLTYAFFSVQAARPKFYFAWTLADAVNNAAGYGFSGMDGNGKASWDLIGNLNILGIETATSFKTFIDNWNIQTAVWLKTVCYDRAPRHRLALTFILSALWHGVFPGYYFTFITAIPITIAARAIRKSVRHHFLSSRGLKLGYDVLTWAATQLTICYTVMPFLLLSVEPTFIYYRSMYFHVHVISILAAVALQPKHKSRETRTSSSSSLSSVSPVQCQPDLSNNNGKID